MRQLVTISLIAQLSWAFIAQAEAPAATTAVAPAIGPLRVLAANPRYFTDGSGRAVLLTGSHTWASLQDYTYATLPAPPPFDFDAYLSFLRRNNHNFFRLWAWESPVNKDALQGSTFFEPMPYGRPGPGLAADGKPKFDLAMFNQAYFDRMRARVIAARSKGIYVSVMLFQGFSIEGKGNDGGDPWWAHPFNPRNNINGIDGGGSGGAHTLSNEAVTALQESYVRKVIDTVNDLDNVLYEITNEDTGGLADTAWQYHMITFIKGYETAKPRRHPVGMTVQWPQSDDEALFASPADWISPGAKLPSNDGRKVIINDTDHSFFWIALKKDGVEAQRAWVWENFTRGNQCLFMDPYLDPSHDPGRNDPVRGSPDIYWDALRQAMGHTRDYAMRMNLAAMSPHEGLSSTKFCLADRGREYLAFQPESKCEFTLNLAGASGRLSAKWFNVREGVTVPVDQVEGGAARSFTAPFAGASVLYLKR